MDEMELYMKNLEREKELRAKLDKSVITIQVIDEWGGWERKGDIHKVRKYPFKATKEGTVASCMCPECVKEREGKELFDMYEVVEGEHRGGIIPVVACKIIGDK